jgi:hypothetical protein
LKGSSRSDSSCDEMIYSSSDLHESNEDDSEEEFIETQKPIFEGSLLTLDEFTRSFVWITNYLRIPKNKKDTLLKYIKALLPSNSLPSSYYKISKNSSTKSNMKKYRLCNICYSD